MGKKKSAKDHKKDKRHKVVSAETWKTKKKCCRSNPRCKKCPVVLNRLVKAGAFDAGADLKGELKLARRW